MSASNAIGCGRDFLLRAGFVPTTPASSIPCHVTGASTADAVTELRYTGFPRTTDSSRIPWPFEAT